MVRDPVCKMEVDEEKAPFKSTFEGKDYFFCTETCKKDFDKNPRLYIAWD